MTGSDNPATTPVSFTHKTGTAPAYLDLHFEACRPAYEAMLRSVGLQSGWRVIDAGCGVVRQEPHRPRRVHCVFL
jgi:hypothetical protein